MRKSLAVGLLVTFSWLGALGQDARAGVTIDVHWQDGTGHALTISAGQAGPGCFFGGYYGGSTATGRCMDVIVASTHALVELSASVTYDSDNGLALRRLYEWKGIGTCSPSGGLVDNDGVIQSFDCRIPPPNNPPVLAAGTYKIGTIVWDTSGTFAGGDNQEVIAAYIDDLVDIVGAVINGTVIDVSDSVVLGSAVLNITGDPNPVPSISATGVTLLGVAVFGIGIMGLLIAARRRPN